MADCAVPIVGLTEGSKNRYKLNLKELEKILSCKDIAGKKVALISIAGVFRKGKSFLLNFFVTYLEWLQNGGKGDWFDERSLLDKFHFRGGTERDTNGIFLWIKPYVFLNEDGEEIVVLLMDTQGTFDHKSTMQDCATIFALSTLVSSVQIFNISQQIQEDDLNNLRLFTEYAKLVQNENSRNQAPFQRLLFLVRDWPNSQVHDYGYKGGKDYLEYILKSGPKQKKELQDLRMNIKTSFDSLLCFLMPHPGLRIAQNNSEKALGKVEPDFERLLDHFVPSLFGEGGSQLEAKVINGHELTCSELLELFKCYMQIFNDDELPEPKTILDATVEALNISAEQKAKKAYDTFMGEKMDENVGLADSRTLHNFQITAVKAALKVFEERPKLGDQDSAAVNQNNLKAYFDGRFREYKRIVDNNVGVAEEKRRLQAEKLRERERIKAEDERLRQKSLLQAQRHREQQYQLERQRMEQERRAREEEQRLKRERDDQERRQRKLQEQMKREREEQDQRNRAEEARIQRQREELQEQQRISQRRSACRIREDSGNDELLSLLSMIGIGNMFGNGGSSTIRAESYTSSLGNEFTRYRDMSTGRFCNNPYQ